MGYQKLSVVIGEEEKSTRYRAGVRNPHSNSGDSQSNLVAKAKLNYIMNAVYI